ncbi:MAG: hypothetical protein GXO55_11120 [Chloroflexi bacterium]|nr:hypothetical protein [Chloroflexota bacterium]
MELNEYIAILRKRGWIIILTAVLTALAGWGISRFQEPMYRASIQVRVEPARIDWGNVNAVKTLLRSYQVLITSQDIVEEVIRRAQLDMTPEQLLSLMKVDPDESNFTIRIDVENRDPEVAKRIAETTAQVFIENREQWNQKQRREDRVDVSIRNHVTHVPLVRPKPKMNALAGFVLGVLIGVLIVLLLEWIEADILRTPEAVERALGLATLGAIPGERRGR